MIARLIEYYKLNNYDKIFIIIKFIKYFDIHNICYRSQILKILKMGKWFEFASLPT